MQRWQIFSRYAESNGLGVEDAYAVKGSQPKKRKTISCSKTISGTLNTNNYLVEYPT